MSSLNHRLHRWRHNSNGRRRGIITVLSAVILIVVFAFVAFAVDTGRIITTQQDMQNACDAAALAASQELTAIAWEAGENGSTPVINEQALEAARQVAADVADHNGVYIDPAQDVIFGKRYYDASTDTWPIAWNVQPFNVAKVVARRTQPDTSQPDGKLQLSFGWAVGRSSVPLTTSTSAFVQSRDAVLVLDFSASMNDDSEFKAISHLGQQAVEENMEDIFNELGSLDLGSMTFDPQWLTVEGPAPETSDQAQIDVTFMNTSAFVDSTKELVSVTLGFTDGESQSFDGLSGTEDTFSGTEGNSGKTIATVWVESGTSSGGDGYGSVTLVGQTPQHGSQPQIEVTFEGTSISVESSKDLSNVVLEFSDGVHHKFDGLHGHTGTFEGIGANAGKFITKAWIKSGANHSGDGPGYGERFENPQEQQSSSSVEEQRFDDTVDNVKIAFSLNDTDYPYPSGSWDSFISYVRSDSDVNDAGYRRKYGGLTFVNYLLENQKSNSATPDLWKTPHYPFHAVKEGASLFCDFLQALGYGDEVGLVSYDSSSRVEMLLDDGVSYVDISSDPITSNYDAIDTIQSHKQAGHYSSSTGMGYGIRDAGQLLLGDPDDPDDSGYARPGAEPTMIIMTDGQTNQYPSSWAGLPSDWDWAHWTDYDDDGNADYSTSATAKQYAFWEATQAIEAGITLHTMSVGVNADAELMEAIAFAGGGVHIAIPGGASIEDMQDQVMDAFAQIGSKVPPAKIIRN